MSREIEALKKRQQKLEQDKAKLLQEQKALAKKLTSEKRKIRSGQLITLGIVLEQFLLKTPSKIQDFTEEAESLKREIDKERALAILQTIKTRTKEQSDNRK